MSFKAVTIINGEVYDGLHQTIEGEDVTPVVGMVRPRFKAEMDMKSGHMRDLGGLELSASDLRMTDTGVLGTARNSGMPVRGIEDIKDTTLVTYNGIEMDAKSAAQLGLLSRNADGRYIEKKYDGDLSIPAKSDPYDTQAPHDQEANDEEALGMSSDLYDSEVESCLESVAQELGSYDALDRHAISVMGSLADGDITGCAKRLASDVGAEPEATATFITQVAERFIDRSANYITRNHNVDGSEVIEWAAQHIPAHERASIANEVYLGRTAALDRMAERYKQNAKRCS